MVPGGVEKKEIEALNAEEEKEWEIDVFCHDFWGEKRRPLQRRKTVSLERAFGKGFPGEKRGCPLGSDGK